jgi:hypothetical protein
MSLKRMLKRARRDHVRRGVADVDRRDLQARGLERGVARVDGLRGQRREHAQERVDRVVGEVRVADMALHACHLDGDVHAPAAADLGHVAEHALAGRLAHDAGIEALAAAREQVEHLARAVDRGAFLVARDQQADRAAEAGAARGEEALRRGDEGRDRALHVRGAAAVERAVVDLAGEGRDRPAVEVADRHDVAVAREAEMRAARADAGVEVVDVGRAGFRERHALAAEAERAERALEHAQHALVLRGHRGAADQGLREADGIDLRHRRPAGHPRRSSLIEVLERVFSSTRFTITAQ